MEYHKSQARDLFETVVITAIIALFTTTFVVQAFKIPTGSMESNLLIGDHLLVNKFVYGQSGILEKLLPYKEPKRGDVIVFKYPEKPEIAYVKRLIGLPGDKIEVKGRTVYVNDSPLDEKYTQFINPGSIHDHYGPAYLPQKGDKIEVMESAVKVNGSILDVEVVESYPDRNKTYDEPFLVLQDQYFAMGDNRDNSMDSRFWGSVPRDYFLGKALVIYWSFETPRDEYLRTGILDRIKQYANVVKNFFSKTRWKRTLKVIR
ncbi:MAG: signal peptidase I [Acidobacteria bacterium]|nr:signal peptidase I [Acidobacteriota bacterium]